LIGIEELRKIIPSFYQAIAQKRAN